MNFREIDLSVEQEEVKFNHLNSFKCIFYSFFMEIEPLSPRTLEDAIVLLEDTFTENSSDDNPRDSLNFSIFPEHHPQKSREFGNKYWVLKDNAGKVRGVTGLHYDTLDSESAVWGGWTAVDKKSIQSLSRYGLNLLKFVLDEVIKTNKDYLRFYMFEKDLGGIAHRLYLKANAREFKRDSGKVYFEIDLNQVRSN